MARVLDRIAAVLLACLSVGSAVAEQPYPNRSIRIVVGSGVELHSRIIGEYLQRVWGQPVVVESRPGAGGSIAASAVAAANPDGYTLLFATPTYTLNTALKTTHYDLLKDFRAVSLVSSGGYVLFAHTSVPVRSVAELLLFARQQPGGINCGSPGIGTPPHLACRILNRLAGMTVVHVPYRNAASALAGIITGEVQVSFIPAGIADEQAKSGTIRALAVTTEQRSQSLPALPTMAEMGFSNFVMRSWAGFLAPAGTPGEIVEKLNLEIQRAVEAPDVRQRLVGAGVTPLPPHTLGAIDEFLRDDIARWGRLMGDAGLNQ